ncbi:MAG: ferritin-like domain-containing protein [Acidimicrobiia bacterium]|nr:ferritin-like domain-containing protein [Acidimicrobiia bacterium]
MTTPTQRPAVDLARDEIRRELRAAQADQRAALPAWRQAMARTFGGGRAADAADKATLLGLPTDRRGFLRVGGLTVTLGALAAACGEDSDTGLTRTGQTVPTTEPPPEALPSSEELDLDLLRTASSIEALAVATYQAAIDADWLVDAAVRSTATLFAEQHAEHLAALSDTLSDIGGQPYTEPNPFLAAEVVDPEVDGIGEIEEDEERQTAVLNLAYQLENVASQTYTSAGLLLTTADLRQVAMSIGAVESRHVAVILGVVGDPQVPFALGRTVGAAPEEAFVGP